MATVIIEGPPAASTARGSVITLVNSSIGAGILSLPYAFRCTGWAAGLICTVVIAAVEAFTLYVLSRYAEHTGTKTYGALVHKMLGRRASMVMGAVIFFFLLGSCIAYLMIIGDSFQPLLLQAFGPTWWTTRNTIITAVSCTCILPLMFHTRLGALRAVSSVAVWGLLVIVGIVVFRSAQIVAAPGYSWEPVRAFNPSLQFWGALPLIILGFSCHTTVISVFEELEQYPSLLRPSSSGSLPGLAAADPVRQPDHDQVYHRASGYQSLPSPRLLAFRSRRQLKTDKLRGMIWVVVAVVALTAMFYICMGLAGYLAFPANTHSDILLNFGSDDTLMQVARAAVGLLQVASYPVNHFPARAAIRDLLHQTTGHFFVGSGFTMVESLAFFGSTLAVSLMCSDLGVVFKLVGGTCGAILILSIPGALLIQYAYAKHRESRQQRQMLREPLLLTAATAEAGEAPGSGLAAAAGAAAAAAPEQQQQAQPEQLPPVYSLWWSKLFWSGVLLQLLSVALCALTIATIVSPL